MKSPRKLITTQIKPGASTSQSGLLFDEELRYAPYRELVRVDPTKTSVSRSVELSLRVAASSEGPLRLRPVG